MQLPHPIYDMGQFLLERHVAEMKVMLTQIGSRADLSDATKQRMAYFQALTDRFELVIPVLENWCASAQKIHNDPKADKYSYGQIRQLLGGTDDLELEYGTDICWLNYLTRLLIWPKSLILRRDLPGCI